MPELPGLYVHVPFCARACPYCDFDFDVGGRPDVDGYLRGLAREWETHRDIWAPARFGTVYFGGGTPSMLGLDGLERLGRWVHDTLNVVDCVEWTVEVNPEHCDRALMRGLRAMGVHRISLGSQTFAPEGLRQLGRAHDAARASAAAGEVLDAGMVLCLDLMVGWPGQSEAQLSSDVARVLDLGADHVSVYALSIEADTPWEGLVRRGRRELPDPDLQALYLAGCRRQLEAGGFEHYEVANFCRPGHASVHNSKYWTWCDYLGLGPSAHSARFQQGRVLRCGNRRGFQRWAAAPGEAELQEVLDPEQAAAEGLWTGLRMLRGMDVQRFLTTFDRDLAWLRAKTVRQVALGNLERVQERGADALRVVRDRWLWHDSIAEDLLAPIRT